MKAHKTQLTIILALTVVLFILIGATAIQARTAITRPSVPVIADADKPAEEEPTDPTAGYSLTRTARLSLGDAEIENNYGGSGNETARFRNRSKRATVRVFQHRFDRLRLERR